MRKKSTNNRGRVAEFSAYLDPGAMTKAQYDAYVDRNGFSPFNRPQHVRNPKLLDSLPAT